VYQIYTPGSPAALSTYSTAAWLQYGVLVPGRAPHAAPHASPILERTERTYARGVGMRRQGRRILESLETCHAVEKKGGRREKHQ
jgi:hypothetical protein